MGQEALLTPITFSAFCNSFSRANPERHLVLSVVFFPPPGICLADAIFKSKVVMQMTFAACAQQALLVTAKPTACVVTCGPTRIDDETRRTVKDDGYQKNSRWCLSRG